MKKAKRGELRAEYQRSDLGRGVRREHLKAYTGGSNLVRLKPDIAAAFPMEKAVDETLRSLLKIAHQTVG